MSLVNLKRRLHEQNAPAARRAVTVVNHAGTLSEENTGYEISTVQADGDSRHSRAVPPAPPPGRVTVLKHCRCSDCRSWLACTIPVIDEQAWHYCTEYNGPQVSRDVLVVHYPAQKKGRMLEGQDEGGHPGTRGKHPTSRDCSAGARGVNVVEQPPAVGHVDAPVGPRSNATAKVEHQAKDAAPTRHGPTGRVVGPTNAVCQNGTQLLLPVEPDGSFPAKISPLGTRSSQPPPFCLSTRRTSNPGEHQ
ncbi:MAG: hypothetical protein BIFFINMI_03794 [Phycisphaerae bacterium]|nr:hypothetical protein [Phycisphaerae bacterium]